MRIIVLDSGICSTAFDLPELIFDLEIAESGMLVSSTHPVKPFSHGSICAAIIDHYLKQWKVTYELGSIRVLDADTGRGDIADLLTALKWCETQEPCIIHMSIGSELLKDADPIHEVIKQLRKKGFVMVAARSNHQGISYPACFSEVVGVRTALSLKDDACRLNPTSYDGIDYLASSCHTLTTSTADFVTPYSNSYAAPLITAMLTAGMISTQERYAQITGFGEHSGQFEDTAVIVITGEKRELFSFTEQFLKVWLEEGYQAAVCNDTDIYHPNWYRYDEQMVYGMIRQMDLGVLLVVTMNSKDIKRRDFTVELCDTVSFETDRADLPCRSSGVYAEELQRWIVQISESTK